MTTPGPWGPPPAPPPESAPGWQPPPYGGPGVAPGAPPGYYRAPRNNTLAIVSLVFGCAQIMFCILGAIVAVVTGHIALSQIKRTNEQGKGLAIAGVVLGYVGLALTIGLIVLVIALGESETTTFDDLDVNFGSELAQVRAQDFVNELELVADNPSTTLRDPAAIRSAATAPSSGFAHTVTLPDGTPVETATRDDFVQNGWRVEVSLFAGSVDSVACVTIPAWATTQPIIEAGYC